MRAFCVQRNDKPDYREVLDHEILEAGDTDLVDGVIFYPLPASCTGKVSGEAKSGLEKAIRVRRLKMVADKPKLYTERDIIELMVRAPAVPEWWEPTMGPEPRVEKWKQVEIAAGVFQSQPDLTDEELKEAHRKWNAYQVDKRRQRAIQWPRAYALMVLEAK